MQKAMLGKMFLSLSKKLRVDYSNRQLVCQDLQGAQVVVGECVGLLALHIENSHDPIADFQGQGRLGASLRKKWIGIVGAVTGDIIDDERFAMPGNKSDDRF